MVKVDRNHKIVFTTIMSIMFLVMSFSLVSAHHTWWHFWGDEPQLGPGVCKDCPNLNMRGDANNDCVLDISDVKKITDLYSTAGLFCNGQAYYEPADVNGDKLVDLSDAKYLADYLFNKGKAPLPIVTKTTCSDSDGGIREDIKGVVNGTNSTGRYQYSDYCISTMSLGEYICDLNNQPAVRPITCQNGCQDGKCNPIKPVNVCGNGIVEAAIGEQCDDGNLVNGDGCSRDCKKEIVNGTTCTDSDGGRNYEKFGYVNVTNSSAPGGYSDYYDKCSGDSKWVYEQFCNADGTHTTGFVTCENGCENGACKANQTAICGNAKVEGTEQCDDGNLVNGDGCSSTCQIENNPPVKSAGIFQVTAIVNGTTTYSNAKVQFVDIKTGQVYDATLTGEGIGTVSILGKSYTVKYTASSSSEENFIEILPWTVPGQDIIPTRAFKKGYLITHNLNWNGRILKVENITNSSGFIGDIAKFVDIKTGETFSTVFTADGQGSVIIDGKEYSVHMKYLNLFGPNIKIPNGLYIEFETLDFVVFGPYKFFQDSYVVFLEPITPPQPVTCQLTGASWNVTNSTVGQRIALAVTGSDCEGQDVSFDVFEDDGGFGADDPALFNPNPGKFVGGVANSVWTVEAQCDGDLLGICTLGKPEYYFIAKLVSDPSKTVKSPIMQVV